MCGICGFTGKITNHKEVIKSMTDQIIHRGPDSSGFYYGDDVTMGFRRLSIIDISDGNQPIYNEDKSLVLNFNGEIYNYKELREELIALDHCFYTNSDSEILLHAFEQWQEQMLGRLRGMFAFAILNVKTSALFIARDFFGIKPLYYTNINGQNFVWASEIKSILKVPDFKKTFNHNALNNYLSFKYSPGPETFFEGVYSLPPGCYLWYKNNEIKINKYFEASFNINKNLTLGEAVKNIEYAMEDSIDAHKISDVEVGCFLSSGIDSSYIASFFKGQKAFTVGFDLGEKYNEINWTKKFAKEIEINHYHHIISSEDFWNSIKEVQYLMDQPLADPSCIALYFVAQLASQHVKVVLSGEGADELFGGYTFYTKPKAMRLYQKMLPQFLRTALKHTAQKLPFSFKGKSFIMRCEKPIEQSFIGQSFVFDQHEKHTILKDSSLASDPIDLCKEFYDCSNDNDLETKMQLIDINFWLPGDILLKADRMSMAHSLELRVPFLDKEVFNVASTLPTEFRVNKQNTKYALRLASMSKLPEKNAQKPKLGFPVPTRVWLRDSKYYNIVKTAFSSKIAGEFFNQEAIIKYLDDHYHNKYDNYQKIWTIYMFLIWYEIYFEE